MSSLRRSGVCGSGSCLPLEGIHLLQHGLVARLQLSESSPSGSRLEASTAREQLPELEDLSPQGRLLVLRDGQWSTGHLDSPVTGVVEILMSSSLISLMRWSQPQTFARRHMGSFALSCELLFRFDHDSGPFLAERSRSAAASASRS